MRVAVTGTTGRVGAALAAHFAEEHDVIPLPRQSCNLADPRSLAATLKKLHCDVFFNPAAITSLEACEDDPKLAMRVNARAPGEIAAWAAKSGVKFFHFSTDYVFKGDSPGLRGEAESPAPVGVYGRSKLAGESAVLAWPTTCVVRVAWVFGPERPSFVDSVFDTALQQRPLAAVADKFSLPVFTRDLANWMGQINLHTRGILHACNSGEPVSWHGMAAFVVGQMVACGVLAELPAVQEQTLDGIPAFRAPRPRFTAMETRRLAAILGREPRSWQAALSEYVRERCSRL